MLYSDTKCAVQLFLYSSIYYGLVIYTSLCSFPICVVLLSRHPEELHQNPIHQTPHGSLGCIRDMKKVWKGAYKNMAYLYTRHMRNTLSFSTMFTRWTSELDSPLSQGKCWAHCLHSSSGAQWKAQLKVDTITVLEV